MNHDYLTKILDYNPSTGEFKWKQKMSQRINAGDVAGTFNKKGCVYIGIKKVYYTAARLAWFYIKGSWPLNNIRFKDGDSTNLRFDNLIDKIPTPANKRIKAWHDSHPGAAKNAQLKTLFGITLKEYEFMYIKQQGKCGVCKKPEVATRQGKLKRLCVDHNHKTDKIRELLCDRCNLLLGMAGEDVIVLTNAIEYLKKHSVEENDHVA